MKKFNLRILGVFTLVQIFFALGLKNVVFILYNDEAYQIITTGSIKGFTPDELSNILLISATGSLIGLLISFITSLILSLKYKLGYINSILAFIISLLVNRFILMKIVISPGQVLFNSPFSSSFFDLIFFTLICIGVYLFMMLKMKKKYA
jgi:hypothetical protein